MNFSDLLQALSNPAAYPHPAEKITVHQTHISAVFLAGEFAYKIKKPLNLGFLDFTTLESREHFCREEVRLNRRLAPEVYLDVVPIMQSSGRLSVGGKGETVEWAVKMKRLDECRTLLSLLKTDQLRPDILEILAERLTKFYAGADGENHIAEFGRWSVVAANCHENFEQVAPYVGRTISADVFEKLKQTTTEKLEKLMNKIKSRAKRHVPRDTHGDLHLDHVYLFPEEKPPNDLVIVDCIEFNERFRFSDPVADIAFLVMDLKFRGRPDLAEKFAEAYFSASGDEEGKELLPFYVSYRAVVRGKVEGFELKEAEIPKQVKEAALQRARAHFLLASSELSAPAERPCLVLIAGLPGSGKSTIARGLVEKAGFTRISSDQTRKELAGIKESETARTEFGSGIYTSEWNDRTYDACLKKAESLLFQGKRVVVDASFAEEKRRIAFLNSARAWGVPSLLLLCTADETEIKSRLSRPRENFSDAGWTIYQQAVKRFEKLGSATPQNTRTIETTGLPEQSVQTALNILAETGVGE